MTINKYCCFYHQLIGASNLMCVSLLVCVYDLHVHECRTMLWAENSVYFRQQETVEEPNQSIQL